VTGIRLHAPAPGWDIDDLVFTGLANTPFPTLVANAAACEPGAGSGSGSGGDDGGCQTTGGSAGGGTLAALAVLGMVLVRRRRRG